MDALGSPACTPAPPPTATRAGAETRRRLPRRARPFDRAPRAASIPRRSRHPRPRSSSARRRRRRDAVTVSRSARRAWGRGAGPGPDREPDRTRREARAKKRPRETNPDARVVRDGGGADGGMEHARVSSIGDGSGDGEARVRSGEARADGTPADATTKLSEVKTDAPPPAPEPAAKVRRARRGTAAAAAAAAETTPSRGRGPRRAPRTERRSQVFEKHETAKPGVERFSRRCPRPRRGPPRERAEGAVERKRRRGGGFASRRPCGAARSSGEGSRDIGTASGGDGSRTPSSTQRGTDTGSSTTTGTSRKGSSSRMRACASSRSDRMARKRDDGAKSEGSARCAGTRDP